MVNIPIFCFSENDRTKQNKICQYEELMFSNPWQNSDAVLIVEGNELHVHTLVLSIASPVFERMFNGNFKEAETKRVTLEGKLYDMVKHMLKLVYPADYVEIRIFIFISFH